MMEFPQTIRPAARYTAFCLGTLVLCFSPVRADNDIPVSGKTAPQPMNFAECVRVGLQQSSVLKKSAIEIDVRRLAESDMKWDYAPSIYINTSYYVTKPDYASGSYDLSLTTGPYDFIQPYFGVRAARGFTRIAVLTHLQAIADGLHEIGKIFFRMEAADQTLAVQDDVIRLAEQNEAQSEALKDSPDSRAMDRQIAASELAAARTERERLLAVKSAIRDRLFYLIGNPLRTDTSIVTSNTYGQVIGAFAPERVTLRDASEHSTELQIRDIEKKLQDLNIHAAYAKYIPSPFASLRTADPLQSGADDGLYLTVGVNFQIWDGLDRRRNVTRQKNVLRQIEMDFENAEQTLKQTWSSASNQYRIASLDLKVAEAQEEIARLKKEQHRIGHESGTLPAFLLRENLARHLAARKAKIAKTLDYNLSVLYMRHLSGDLQESYVDQKAFSVELREGTKKGQGDP
jgi:outer membrane protein TolC